MAEIVEKGFYLMRHGRILNNELGIETGGGIDQPLSADGRLDAENAKKVFKLLNPLPTDIIVTDLSRTVETAEIMTELQARNFTVEPALKERMLGELDGKLTHAQYKTRKPLPDEESPEHHAGRVIEALNKRLSRPVEIPLFVTHGGTIRRIFEAMGAKERMEVGNAEIFQLIPVNHRWHIFALSEYKGNLIKKDVSPKQKDIGLPFM